MATTDNDRIAKLAGSVQTTDKTAPGVDLVKAQHADQADQKAEKRTRVRKPVTGLDLTTLSVEDAPAPVRTVSGRNPEANPFVAILRDLWTSRPNGAAKSAGKAVTVPADAENEVINAIRGAANYHTKTGLAMGVAIDTDKPGDGSKPAVPKGKVRIRFAAKQRKARRERTA